MDIVNTLSAKLKWLEELGIITKAKMLHNKKTNLYHLKDKGLSLARVIVELALWSDQHLRAFNPVMQDGKELAFMQSNKEELIKALKQNYKTMVAKALQS
jgi:DNA-binding MarR family transcriptional regulator